MAAQAPRKIHALCIRRHIHGFLTGASNANSFETGNCHRFQSYAEGLWLLVDSALSKLLKMSASALLLSGYSIHFPFVLYRLINGVIRNYPLILRTTHDRSRRVVERSRTFTLSVEKNVPIPDSTYLPSAVSKWFTRNTINLLGQNRDLSIEWFPPAFNFETVPPDQKQDEFIFRDSVHWRIFPLRFKVSTDVHES